MSRFEVRHQDKGLAFGNDHACGEFLMIWKRPTDEKERQSQDAFGPDPEEVIVDEDTLFTGFTRERYLALLAEHGFTEGELADVYNAVETPAFKENWK